MPNKRGTLTGPAELETAHPWPPGRFEEPEPQAARGAPGSRGMSDPDARNRRGPSGPRRGRGQQHSAQEWSGVNPLDPILPSMPRLKTGDQGG